MSHAESPFSEAEEQELAAELLGVNSDRELEQVLGTTLSRAASTAGGTLHPPVVRALGGLLKNAVRQILPGAGGNFESLVASQTNGQLAAGAARLLELEGEGMSAEDQEFEAARQLVRLGASAAAQATANQTEGNPAQVAQQAMVSAAQQFAPGLLRRPSRTRLACGCHSGGRCSCRRPAAGTWEHRRRRIILHGV